jgi:carotenoid cleavage dioxygenase-like enzyme
LRLDEVMLVPAGPGEDDGYLLAFLYERQRDKSSLIILDASDVTQPPIAQIRLPVRVPVGLHGHWPPTAAG